MIKCDRKIFHKEVIPRWKMLFKSHENRMSMRVSRLREFMLVWWN
jgi:hypothetical protein